MDQFVRKDSIVRKIWGKSDTVLLVFAGGAAEFALNKAVDWLFFTGRLPADPLGRLFSTVMYARQIVFASQIDAIRTIEKITSIHSAVEANRKDVIPDWAYRDVLFMLIFYSMAAFELIERKMTSSEKNELYDVFRRVGEGMGLKDLPSNYLEWEGAREEHLDRDLAKSKYTDELFRQYRKHLGSIRYLILIESQKLIMPKKVRKLLQFGSIMWFRPVLTFYKLCRAVKLDSILKAMILPGTYKKQIKELDQ